MKHVYNYQEIGTLIDQGKPVVFPCHPEARVTTLKKNRKSDIITVTLLLSIGDTCIGIVENEYASIEMLLEAFQIDDLLEMWEVLE